MAKGVNSVWPKGLDRLNDGNRFIVKEGLSVGDTIVAEGVGLVREGMSITPKNETK